MLSLEVMYHNAINENQRKLKEASVTPVRWQHIFKAIEMASSRNILGDQKCVEEVQKECKILMLLNDRRIEKINADFEEAKKDEYNNAECLSRYAKFMLFCKLLVKNPKEMCQADFDEFFNIFPIVLHDSNFLLG